MEESKIGLDDLWNDYCNATIYFAYKKGLLNPNECINVRTYIEKYGEEVFKKSYRKIEIYNKKQFGNNIKSKIKKYIKRLIRK